MLLYRATMIVLSSYRVQCNERTALDFHFTLAIRSSIVHRTPKILKVRGSPVGQFVIGFSQCALVNRFWKRKNAHLRMASYQFVGCEWAKSESGVAQTASPIASAAAKNGAVKIASAMMKRESELCSAMMATRANLCDTRVWVMSNLSFGCNGRCVLLLFLVFPLFCIISCTICYSFDTISIEQYVGRKMRERVRKSVLFYYTFCNSGVANKQLSMPRMDEKAATDEEKEMTATTRNKAKTLSHIVFSSCSLFFLWKILYLNISLAGAVFGGRSVRR